MEFVAIETEESGDPTETKITDSVVPPLGQEEAEDAGKDEFDNRKNDAYVETDWMKFKSDFDESLQASEQRVASGQINEPELPLNDLKQQLLFDAILAMHEEKDPAPIQTVASMDNPRTTHSCEYADSTTIEKSEGSFSPSKTRRSILSLGALDTIHESELDRVLETVPDLPITQLPANNQTTDVGADDKPPPKLVWGKEDTGVLLTELKQLSKSDSDHVRYSETRSSHSPRTSPDKWSKLNKGNLLITPD